MSKEQAKKEYEKLGLTDFEEVNQEFEFSGIEIEKWIFSKAMIRVVLDKINRLMNYVVPFFIPGGYYSSVIMGSVKDKETINRAMKLYKELMVWSHKGMKVELESNEENRVKFFKDFWKEYPRLKNEVLEFIVICEDVFKKESQKKSSGAYLG